MWIKKWVKGNFSVRYDEETKFIIDLEGGHIGTYRIKGSNYEQIKTKPIRIQDDGLYVWEFDGNGWVPVNDQIKEEYSNYLAEKELLGNGGDDEG